MKEPVDRKLGHLASDLLRIANFLDNPKNIRVVESIIDESKFFIEWLAPEAPFDTQVLLAEIQPKLAFLQLRLAKQENLGDLRNFAKIWSKQLIEASGFLV